MRMRFFAAALLLATPAAASDFKVKLPYVDQGEIELEHKGIATFDRDPAKSDNQKLIGEIGYGVTDWWATKFEAEWEREEGPGHNLGTQAVAWENIFALTPQGKYLADVGFFVEMEHGIRRGANEEISFGPIVAKEIGPTLTAVNVFFTKEIGPNADERVAFNYRFSSRWMLFPWLEPGLEVHGEPGAINRFLPAAEQDHRAGPVIYGALPLPPGWGKLQYQLGYLFGLTTASPDGTLKWLLEYELRF
jgi:hypothetical protein